MTKSSITLPSFGDVRTDLARQARPDFSRREETQERERRFRRRIRQPLPDIMHSLNHELAKRQASSDGEPRIVAHEDTISLVTPRGEVWRVFDSAGPDGEMRHLPLSDDRVWGRIFVRLDEDAEPRILRFGPDESRSTAAKELLSQLERAT